VPRLDIRGGILDDPYRSPSQSTMAAWIELSIGVTGQPGANLFAVHVGTPEAVLESRLQSGGRMIDATLLVREWSETDIERAVRGIVARCDTGEWRLSVAELERHFRHEFQDYDEVPDKLPVIPMIKSCRAADLHLPTWEPLADEPVCLEVRLTVGIRKQPDDREYVVTIATPAGLRANRSAFVLADRGVLLISDYRWDTIAAQLAEIVASCRGTDWAHCQRKLERYFVDSESGAHLA
jgi:hypothetical protein